MIQTPAAKWLKKHNLQDCWKEHTVRLRELARGGIAAGDIRELARDRNMPFGTLRRVLYDPDIRPPYLQTMGVILGWTEEKLLEDIRGH